MLLESAPESKYQNPLGRGSGNAYLLTHSWNIPGISWVNLSKENVSLHFLFEHFILNMPGGI